MEREQVMGNLQIKVEKTGLPAKMAIIIQYQMVLCQSPKKQTTMEQLFMYISGWKAPMLTASMVKKKPRGQGKWFFYCPSGILDFQELNICCCSYTHFFSFCTIVACKPRIPWQRFLLNDDTFSPISYKNNHLTILLQLTFIRLSERIAVCQSVFEKSFSQSARPTLQYILSG